MTERWGTCPTCKGAGRYYLKNKATGEVKEQECGRCLGEGFDGSADAYMAKEYAKDFESERLFNPPRDDK